MKNNKYDTGGPESRTMEDVARYIRKMRFRKRIIGGVDEADVWRNIEALHKEYEAVFLRQKLEYEKLLERPPDDNGDGGQ